MDAVRSLSLLDLAGRTPASWYVCYMNRENPRWWNALLKIDYQHVQLRRQIPYGPELTDVLWLVMDPCLSHVDAQLYGPEAAPWFDASVKHTQRVEFAPDHRQVREWFSFGPVTCVEIAKACLGINSWRVRTPWQLFKYLRRRGCVLR